ncbi:hypothetical protein ACM9HF_06450 [Colwellia sp. RE-S-Sl-9]
MLQLLKDCWRGFVGGPYFNRCITHRFILENKLLSVSIPDGNLFVESSKEDINFPHTSKTWFQHHVEESYDQHIYVHMLTKNWMYLPVVNLLPSSEYGMLSCQLRIKQTDKINVLDKQALADFVIQEYDDFHNGPNGKNTKIRQEITEQSSKKYRPWSPDRLEEEIAGWIENRGKPSIPPAFIKKINKHDWIFYQEVRNNRLSRNDYYCLPLSKNSFLEVDFRYRVDLSHKHKKWSKHALASQERIMESITLSDIPDEQDNLLVDNSVKNS